MMTPETPIALASRLIELASVVQGLDDMAFVAARPDGVSGSIGAHVRHALDHVAALVDRDATNLVDYDTRRRGTDIERHRPAAIQELRRLASRLQAWSPEASPAAVTVSAVVDEAGRRVAAASTVSRELVFVLSHTIHHQAIIALLLASDGFETPDRFGVAPSTPQVLTCARSA